MSEEDPTSSVPTSENSTSSTDRTTEPTTSRRRTILVGASAGIGTSILIYASLSIIIGQFAIVFGWLVSPIIGGFIAGYVEGTTSWHGGELGVVAGLSPSAALGIIVISPIVASGFYNLFSGSGQDGLAGSVFIFLLPFLFSAPIGAALGFISGAIGAAVGKQFRAN